MLKDITLGQYFPGDTLAHKLDPRTKLLITVLYIVALFTAKSYLAYGILVLTLVIAVRISRVSVKALFKGLKPVLFIIAFTAVLNLFYTPGKEIWHFWIFHMTLEGVRAAVTMMLRITLLIMGTFLLTYTTSPIRLTDGLENLLGPLKAIKLPVHELAMMMSIALRFIPTLIEETDKIMSAQKARGADFESGNIFQRAKALVPILVPLSSMAPRAFWAFIILSVSSIRVGIKRRAMLIIMASSCTGNRSFFRGESRCSSPSVRAMGLVV